MMTNEDVRRLYERAAQKWADELVTGYRCRVPYTLMDEDCTIPPIDWSKLRIKDNNDGTATVWLDEKFSDLHEFGGREP